MLEVSCPHGREQNFVSCVCSTILWDASSFPWKLGAEQQSPLSHGLQWQNRIGQRGMLEHLI